MKYSRGDKVIVTQICGLEGGIDLQGLTEEGIIKHVYTTDRTICEYRIDIPQPKNFRLVEFTETSYSSEWDISEGDIKPYKRALVGYNE